MTKKNTTTNFIFKGSRYHVTDKGYYYKDGKRTTKSEYDKAYQSWETRNKKMEGIADNAKEENMNRQSSNIIVIDGHEYMYNHAEGKCYCDGNKISRAAFNKAIGINKKSDSTKRTRKPKDIGFEHNGVILTTKQTNFLHELSRAGQYGVLGNAKTGWWVDCIVDGIGGQFAGKPMTVGAMISTLCEKGLGIRSKEKRDNRSVVAFNLTEEGKKIWKAMKL